MARDVLGVDLFEGVGAFVHGVQIWRLICRGKE